MEFWEDVAMDPFLENEDLQTEMLMELSKLTLTKKMSKAQSKLYSKGLRLLKRERVNLKYDYWIDQTELHSTLKEGMLSPIIYITG